MSNDIPSIQKKLDGKKNWNKIKIHIQKEGGKSLRHL